MVEEPKKERAVENIIMTRADTYTESGRKAVFVGELIKPGGPEGSPACATSSSSISNMIHRRFLSSGLCQEELKIRLGWIRTQLCKR